MVNLGYMYARGHGVRSDPAYALDLYHRAADAGDAEGMNAVGYRYNYATEPDFPKAIHWYCLAVARGNSRAMNNLALLFYNGQGVPPDRDEALRLWRLSAARGDLNAEANVGVQLATDATLPQDERQAGIEMLRDAAHQGDKFAQDLLRQNGDTETFPPATFSALTLRLEPRNPLPGSSGACGDLIS